MKTLVLGSGGQLGHALISSRPDDVELLALPSAELDITDRAKLDRCVEREQPGLIINAAAYTDVDRAEAEEERAFQINATAVGHLKSAADRVGARLIHLSSDFVFDGLASSPYSPDAKLGPLGAYGRSKAAGECEAGDALIVRTAWLYGPTGRNFLRTMLELMRNRREVQVVADQIGTPTSASSLAKALWGLAERSAVGLHHYTDAGVASWYDFAVAIQEEALSLGLLEDRCSVVPISSKDFPTRARRPSYSVLDKSTTYETLGHTAPHWGSNVRRTLKEMSGYA